MPRARAGYLLAILLAICFAAVETPDVFPLPQTQDSPSCLSEDTAGTDADPAALKRWAESHGGQQTKEAILKRIEALYRCDALSDELFAKLYAESSAAMARIEPNAWCFGGEKAATAESEAPYLAWTENHSREEIKDKLVSKAAGIFKCLTHESRVKYYFRISSAMATAARASVDAESARASMSRSTPVPSTPTPGAARLISPPDEQAGESREFRVWLKTSPCSENRNDWLIISREKPANPGGSYEDASDHFPSAVCSQAPHGCNHDEASVEAELLRTASEFSKYCCKDWSVWRNPLTGEQAVMKDSARIAGSEFSIQARSGICCEEAAAAADLSQEICSEQTAALSAGPTPEATAPSTAATPSPAPTSLPPEATPTAEPTPEATSAPESKDAASATGATFTLAAVKHTGFSSKDWSGPDCGEKPACSLTHRIEGGQANFEWSVPASFGAAGGEISISVAARAAKGHRLSNIISVSTSSGALQGGSHAAECDVESDQSAESKKILNLSAPKARSFTIVINLNRDISYRYTYER